MTPDSELPDEVERAIIQQVYTSTDVELAANAASKLIDVLRIEMAAEPDQPLTTVVERIKGWPNDLASAKSLIQGWIAQVNSIEDWRDTLWQAFEEVGEAEGQLIDPEKLLGHLILKHGRSSFDDDEDFDELLQEHRSIHLEGSLV